MVMIDAIENLHLVTVDILRTFMQAEMECVMVHKNTEGKMVEILTKLDPKIYRKYVWTENGKSVLYVDFKKGRYGTLQVSLVFWRNIISSLQEWWFKINLCDWYVANETENVK